jgi:hypothetical protein
MIDDMERRLAPGRRASIAVMALAFAVFGCQASPVPSASSAASAPLPSGSHDSGDAVVSSPAVSTSLPDGLDRIGWTWTDRQLDAEGNPVRTTIVAGLLGATESFRLDGDGQVDVAADLLAVARSGADRASVETYRIPTGQRLGLIRTDGSVGNVHLDWSSGLVYYVRFRVGVGAEIHRAALDGSSDVVLVELGPNHARNEMPNGTDMFDYRVGADGMFVAESCESGACSLHVAAATDAATTVVSVARGGPALCSVVGVSTPFLVVYDADTCFADSDEAAVPVRVVDIRDGSHRVLNDGPNFEATGILVIDASAQVLVRQRLANGNSSLSLVDAQDGGRHVIVPRLGTFQAAEGEIGTYTAARIALPPGWILLVPDTHGVRSELPKARLVNLVDGRTIEIPSWPSQ